MPLLCEDIEDLVLFNGQPFPANVNFRQILVTGPPGSGKSHVVQGLHGWPQEAFLDVAAEKWWRNPALSLRPREVHLGLPFRCHSQSCSTFAQEWLAHPRPLATHRIVIPPGKRGLFSINWVRKFVFFFLLPDPIHLFALRQERARAGTHPVDLSIRLEDVRRQIAVHEEVALHFHKNGMRILVRTQWDAPPKWLVSPS